MALASFFDKTALAAAAVLQGFDRKRFAEMLEAQMVAVAFDDAAVDSMEGRTMLTLAVNLAARLYPAVALVARGRQAVTFRPSLAAIARAVNGDVTVTLSTQSTSGSPPNAASAPTLMLVAGDTEAHAFGMSDDVTAIYIGSYGWEARVSSVRPVGNGPTALPFGAAAAACLGMANVFRHVFREQLPQATLDHALSLSTLSLSTRATTEPAGAASLDATATLMPDQVNLNEVVLVGAGAVGQGFAWTIARVAGLCGILHVVDPETIDASNPQRYVLATSADEGASKVTLIEALLRPECDPALSAMRRGTDAAADVSDETAAELVAPGIVLRRVVPSERAALTVEPHAARWGAFLSARSQPWRLGRVLIAVDSARDRIAIQGALPRWIANAWTQPGDLGLSRHAGFGESACVACLYMPTNPSALHEDVLVGEAVGLADQQMLVRHLLATNAPVDDSIIAQMAAGLGIPAEPLLAFRGRPLRAFYSEAICGGLALRLQSAQGGQVKDALADGESEHAARYHTGGQPRDRAAVVPMAFQSVLAGVLLAAAVVADAAGLPAPPAGQKAVLDVLRPLGARLLVPVARHSSGKCLCHDTDYRAGFHRQWDSTTYTSQ